MSAPKMKLYLSPSEMGVEKRVYLAEGVRVPPIFMARFLIGEMIVELDVKSDPGRSRVVAMRVEVEDDGEVKGVTVNRLPVAQLLRQAVDAMAWISSPPTGVSLDAFNTDVERVRTTAAIATRRRVSEDRLARVAKIVNDGGDVTAVMASESVGDRQAFRLIKAAKALQQ